MDKINIQDLLPQCPPFVMIDRLLHFDDVFTRTGFTIMQDNIFVEHDMLTQSGVMENMAQTCAARMGYINKYIKSESVKLGFIGSVRNLEFARLPKVGEMLSTQIEVLSEVFSLTLVNAQVRVGDELIASCEMKISITDIE